MQERRARAAYKALRLQVAEALRDADPIGLMARGAPDDEYDPEIGTIIPRLKSASGSDETLVIVHGEFCRWFGEETAGPRSAYRAPARAIWQAWERFRQESV